MQPNVFKILIVDDSRSILAKLEQDLSSEGFKVSSATGARIALENIKTDPPDCIISDMDMPDVDGPSFAKTIKMLPQLCEIPFIILTSRDSAENVKNAIDAGADDFVSKASPTIILAAKIKALMRMVSMRKRLNELQRIEGISQIIGTYNHEINNPLTIAFGHVNALLRSEPNEAQKERMEKIKNQLSRIQELMKKLRESTRLEPSPYAENEKILKVG